MDYHGRIMNIAGKQDGSGSTYHSQYSRGHRDARHAAAEISLEAQAEIKRLRNALEDYACMGLDQCPEPKLKDGSCVRMDCGDRARRALDGQ